MTLQQQADQIVARAEKERARKTPREICREIAADMETDATRFDGQPFNGRTVAEYLGNLGAAVAGLARIVESLCPGPVDEQIFTARTGDAK